ncbi:hypothetical protein XELAEV_18000037mg [Xenopus laevis]|uniref:L1 transposable element RRM domain-containing protein n=1 Tax=Xenopus laevis TaxID=8355 RepID=A0A974GZF0_XENLA|nr:hypothetical protein XELAEV_18000037mg [Xenopus laevis]
MKGMLSSISKIVILEVETGCAVNWSETEDSIDQAALHSHSTKIHSTDASLIEQFKIMLRTELDISTKKITASLSKEIKEISKRTDTLEHRLDDTTTVLEGHETDIDSLRYQLQELQDNMEDIKFLEAFRSLIKNLESDITEFFSLLVPHLPTSKLEMDRVHRALGRPPQEAPVTIAKRRSFKPITAVLQQNNIKYRWAFPFRLHFLHQGKQYSTADLDEATALIQQLHLKQRSTASESPRERD